MTKAKKELKDIRDEAAARLARGEMTGKELTDHLVSKGYEREEASKVASEFRDLGYIDEERYAGLFAAHGERKGWGSGRIRMELTRRGVDPETARLAIAEALESGALSSDRERALEVARKMLGDDGTLDERIKGRIARRLAGYGYGASVIYETLRKLED